MFAAPPASVSEPVVFAGSAAYLRQTSGQAGPVLTIGNFDGVHRGHRALLGQVVDAARRRGVPACVFTFDPPPRSVLAPSQAQPRITAWPERVRLLGECGVDQVIVEHFTPAFAQHPPEWFVREVLGRRIRPVELVVGYDFRFGRARAGTLDTVAEGLPGVPVSSIAAVSDDSLVVSSSAIRRQVQSGDVRGAALLLGRPHQIRGVVVAGDQRGRQLGFPTANLSCASELLPAVGVYAVKVRVNGGDGQAAVANLGVRPTFGSGNELRVEVHILDYRGDLYGQELDVLFVDRIRGESRFRSVDALVTQIRADIDAARGMLDHAS